MDEVYKKTREKLIVTVPRPLFTYFNLECDVRVLKTRDLGIEYVSEIYAKTFTLGILSNSYLTQNPNFMH